MEILKLDEYFKLHLGDSQEILKLYPDNYFDSVVCDPPYHLTSIVKRFGKPGSAPAQFGKDGAFSRASRGFMGKEWDGGDIAFRPEFWAEVYRVLKPGGHLLAFSGSRTYHRMACGIEDAGFDIRDQIMWLYGCLDEETKFVTEYGVEHYSNAIVGQRVLCYDVDTNTYSYQPILEVVIYDYEDTAYRITGDNFEQVVSRNHRCIVEREGRETFALAETLERQENVPVLEDLHALREALHCADKGASCQEQNLQQEMHECGHRSSEQRNYADGTEEGSEDKVLRMRERGLEAGCVDKKSEESNVQQALQRDDQEGCLDCSCTYSSEEIARDIGETAIDHDGGEKSIMERRSDIHTSPRKLSLTKNKTRQSAAGIFTDGAEGRVYSGVSFDGCSSDRKAFEQNGSGSSYKSQCGGQQTSELNAVFNESGSQVVRAWSGHKTAMVRVVPFHLKGKVWCLRVPTGSFVAVRGGVAFPTGNSGFPKSHDVSKGIDKAAGVAREKVRIDASQVRNHKAAGGGRDGAEGATRPCIEQALERGYHEKDSDKPVTEAARQWQGWGSALKPAHEPIVVARKPLIGTIAENVLTYGTGALNIDRCRVGDDVRVNTPSSPKADRVAMGGGWRVDAQPTEAMGRWPANVIHDGSEEVTAPLGEPSRFFYCAKASKRDRDEGLEGGEYSLMPDTPEETVEQIKRLLTL